MQNLVMPRRPCKGVRHCADINVFFHFGYSDLFSPCNHVIIVLCAVVQESGGLLHTGGGDPGHGEAGPSSTPGFHNLIVSRMLYDLYALYIYNELIGINGVLHCV